MRKLYFNALVLEIIDRCNARCAMCYQSAGPKGSDSRGDFSLSLIDIKRVMEEARELDCVGPRVHVSGGEAFIRFQEMVEAFNHARTLEFIDIGSTTNGFWATSPEVALRKCNQLRRAGVSYLEVSLDHWHFPYIDVKRVGYLIDAARATGIRFVLRTLTGRLHDLAELTDRLGFADLSGVLIANSKVQPVGRAATEVPDSEIFYVDGDISGSCDSALNLTISPNGGVYPCCAGADMTEALAFGNVLRERLADVVLKMRTDLMLRQLVHTGSGSLVPILKELGYGHILLERYSSICHLCWHIFKNNEVANALKNYFADAQFEEFVKILPQIPQIKDEQHQ